MPIVTGAPRILVKAPAGLGGAPLAIGPGPAGGGGGFTVEPLFESIGQAVQGIAAPSTWHILTPALGLEQASSWDLCHQLMTQAFGIDGTPPPEFAEPDFQQQWVVDDDMGSALALVGACSEQRVQDSRFPTKVDPFWFRDTAHAQFDAALALIGDPGADRVRIAHLDTGYDQEHLTLPAHLNLGLARNFVDADHPTDARDDSEGRFNSLGHGTGTLGVLAGGALPGEQPMGGAPFAEVVPVRVANGVVLFPTSALARAFDYVHGLCSDPGTRVHVITMSMGGVASQAWAEAVNALYEAGVFVVTAAGNNKGNLPTRNIVFPARFGRVVAACGVMANNTPYADLGLGVMAGDYGPPRKMRTAIAGFTPNIPWAQLGCPELVNYDGAGTSCATPQIAAAAALWIQRHKAAWDAYPQGWMKVEAVRKALFDSANAILPERLGRGALRAHDALAQAPANRASLHPEPPDSVEFPILRLFFGQSLAAAPAQQRMLELEAMQLSQSAAIEEVLKDILPDPGVDPGPLSPKDLQAIADALAAHPNASQALRDALGRSARQLRPAPVPISALDPVRRLHLAHATSPNPPRPKARRLKVFAYDPSLGTNLQTADISEGMIEVRWEDDLRPGPVGEYVEVIDVDPASESCYAPVDLDDPYLLGQDGLTPSDGNPQFHQQMAYAVTMRTIEHFENALGRVALWSPRIVRDNSGAVTGEEYVQRLRIYPHAIRAANAFYSPDRKALLLGYFRASQTDSGDVLPGGLVFGALSHDVIAHETTHALLDGLHRRFQEPTNYDVLAFHEAFADIVALLQHFSMPEALRDAMARTRGDLSEENPLAQLAVQFGQATGKYGPLRDAIGEVVDGKWVRKDPSPGDYQAATEPHKRGSVLVAAVFDAFLQIYQVRTRDLVRLATGGSGILPPGAVEDSLIDMLAREASSVASQVLRICIRALDYCPPVDITFGEYLRALITADQDLVPDDPQKYRVAFISAFRDRGIYPDGAKSLSVGSLVWEPPPLPLTHLKTLLDRMVLSWDLMTGRREAYDVSLENARRMHAWLMNRDQVSDEELNALGFFRIARPQAMKIGDIEGRMGGIEVHSVRPARRVRPDGQVLSDLVVEVTQSFRPTTSQGNPFRGGCTMLIDVNRAEARYFIRKRVNSESRIQAQQALAIEMADDLRATYFMDPERGVEPFALLHRGY